MINRTASRLNFTTIHKYFLKNTPSTSAFLFIKKSQFSTFQQKLKDYQPTTIDYTKKMAPSNCNALSKEDKPLAKNRIIGPIETSIAEKIENDLQPEYLTIRNDSWKHSHHSAKKGVSSIGESHFNVTIVSDKFKELGLKTPLSRHRYIFKLLDDEVQYIHGFQVTCKTHDEWVKLKEAQRVERANRASSANYFK